MKIPERSLEPPEDRRRVYADCMICGESIREYDDCYDIPNFGPCCVRCIDRSMRIEVSID